MAIKFFFQYDQTLFHLPVNPTELTVVIAGNNRTYETVKMGEVNDLRDKRLAEVKIKSFFPVNPNLPWVVSATDTFNLGGFNVTGNRGVQAPKYYIDLIEKIRDEKAVMKFVVSDLNVNMDVSIENFEYTFQAQDDDVHFTLDLKQSKKSAAKNLIPNMDGSNTVANAMQIVRSVSKVIPDRYMVKLGDDLWSISSKLTGQASKYKEIQKYSGLVVGRDPTALKVGSILRIPK